MVLEHITFKSDNRFQPIIEALSVIKQYLGTKYKYFPVSVPIEGIVTGSWTSTVLERVGKQTKGKDNRQSPMSCNRKYYELCVLLQLERALRCKDIWVEGSYEWRNPSEDLPADWTDEQKRKNYYQRLNQPIVVSSFTDALKDEMTTALTELNRTLPGNPEVQKRRRQSLRLFYFPHHSSKTGLFRVTKPQVLPEPQNIDTIKEAIVDRYARFARWFT